MVEVFKTNVSRRKIANRIIEDIRKQFAHYRVNFDLTDVDRILRIECTGSVPDIAAIIRLVTNAGFEADVLPDVPAPAQDFHARRARRLKYQIAL